MCEDKNCTCQNCNCEHNHRSHSHCDCDHDNEFINGYREGDIVGEVDFQIVDKDELQEIKNQGNIGGNLGDDLVNLGFIDKDDPLYEEMKNEGRDGVMYDIEDE